MTAAPIFVADASSNRDRDFNRVLAFVDAAAGSDAVKFQLQEGAA
jgi:sialic acid synthase SpsE